MGRDERDGSGVFAAFLLGAFAGAALALLWAPQPGEETRRYLADRARESKDKAAEAARQGREFVNQQRDSLTDALSRGRDAYQQAKEGEQA